MLNRPNLARISLLYPINQVQGLKGHKIKIVAPMSQSLICGQNVFSEPWRKLGHSGSKAWISLIALSPSIRHDSGAATSALTLNLEFLLGARRPLPTSMAYPPVIILAPLLACICLYPPGRRPVKKGQMEEEIKPIGQHSKRRNQNGGRSWPPGQVGTAGGDGDI